MVFGNDTGICCDLDDKSLHLQPIVLVIVVVIDSFFICKTALLTIYIPQMAYPILSL